MPGTDPFDLQRFVDAQAPVYAQVLRELRAGDKTSHWMWFIFPQLRDLGRSPTARRFGIGSLAEARAYLAHPVLGSRLRECVDVLLGVEGRTAHDILHSPDDLKLRSCLTLFEAAEPGARPWDAALAKYYAGERDALTLDLLSRDGG